MPLYDSRNTTMVSGNPREVPMRGSVSFPVGWRGTVDADGKMISPLLWCDTDTGDVGRYDTDPVLQKWQIDPVTKLVRILYERHPAPLRAATPEDIAVFNNQANQQRSNNTTAE